VLSSRAQFLVATLALVVAGAAVGGERAERYQREVGYAVAAQASSEIRIHLSGAATPHLWEALSKAAAIPVFDELRAEGGMDQLMEIYKAVGYLAVAYVPRSGTKDWEYGVEYLRSLEIVLLMDAAIPGVWAASRSPEEVAALIERYQRPPSTIDFQMRLLQSQIENGTFQAKDVPEANAVRARVARLIDTYKPPDPSAPRKRNSK
jgi:hypothetical protein